MSDREGFTDEPLCPKCGVALADHPGVIMLCNEVQKLRILLLDADRDLYHWVQLAKKQRKELPDADYLSCRPTAGGIQETQRLRHRIVNAFVSNAESSTNAGEGDPQ